MNLELFGCRIGRRGSNSRLKLLAVHLVAARRFGIGFDDVTVVDVFSRLSLIVDDESSSWWNESFRHVSAKMD